MFNLINLLTLARKQADIKLIADRYKSCAMQMTVICNNSNKI